MRPTVDLTQLPYVFSVNRLLLPDKFISELRDRGIHVSREGLEALHETRLLLPLLRVRRDAREIAAVYRRDPHEAWQIAHWQPTSRQDIEDALAYGHLFDPAAERFMPRSSFQRTIGKVTYESSVYLYSPQQLISSPLVNDALTFLRRRKRGKRFAFYLKTNPMIRSHWISQARRLREIATAVIALEPMFYPQVVGALRLEWGNDADVYFTWRDTVPVTRVLRWLDVNATWLAQAASELLRFAKLRDPFGPWAELLAHADARQWEKLRGPARTGIDLRVAAEILLRYYERLVKARRAKALPAGEAQYPSAFDTRLKRHRPLDAVLTDFGLSPHPRLVLVVEGATERLVFPRVMDFFGLRTEEDFISIQDAEGVGRRLDPLVAYIAPRLGEEQQDRYVELLRPPTRLLVVVDAEGPVASAEQREARRCQWVDRLMRTLPREIQKDPARLKLMREQLDRLVQTTTWRRTGDSFEFVHFTDRQIAHAIDRADDRHRKPTATRRIDLVAETRARRGNLKEILHGVSKVDLAEELWPVLEARIRRAQQRGTEGSIPIVRVLDQALRLAHEYPRRGLVLALTAPNA